MGSSSPEGRGRFRDRLHLDVDAVVRELRDGRETSGRAVARLLFLAEAYAAQLVALAPPTHAEPGKGDRSAVERVIPIAWAASGSSTTDAGEAHGERPLGRARLLARRRAHASAPRSLDVA